MSAQTTRTIKPTEHANAVRLRRATKAFETGDIATLQELWSPDLVWTEAGSSPIGGTHRGFNDVLGALTDGIGMLDAFAMTLDEVYADDTMAVGIYTMAFTKDDRCALTRSALATQMLDGRAIAVNAVNTNQAGIDAVLGGTVTLPEQGTSAEHANAARNRQAFEAFQASDMAGLRRWWTDDIVWTEGGNNRLAGTRRGFDEVMRNIGELAALLGDEWTMRLDRVAADDACTVARFTSYYGKGLLDSFVMVSYLGADDRVARVHIINANQAALDALIG